MIEKNKTENEIKKERFEFVLTINDNIICQRYFRINGFNEVSFSSVEFLDTFRYCVRLIKNDIVAKSRIYTWHTAPQVFDTEEQMNNSIHNLHVGEHQFVFCKDTENVFTYSEGQLTPYEGYFSKQDLYRLPATSDNDTLNGYNDDKYEQKYTFKFAMFDNGKEVISEVWDGNQYPKFIRMNVDLSNSKNRYDSANEYESILMNILNSTRNDIIPVIVREICVTCSNNKRYDTKLNGYNLSYNDRERQFFKKLEQLCANKTKKYFSNLGA